MTTMMTTITRGQPRFFTYQPALVGCIPGREGVGDFYYDDVNEDDNKDNDHNKDDDDDDDDDNKDN